MMDAVLVDTYGYLNNQLIFQLRGFFILVFLVFFFIFSNYCLLPTIPAFVSLLSLVQTARFSPPGTQHGPSSRTVEKN